MPEVDFSRVRRLINQKSSQNIDKQPATSETAAETFAADAKTGGDGLNLPARKDLIAGDTPDRQDMRRPYGGVTGSSARAGFVLTSDLWQQEGRAIELHAGPSAVSWSLPLRAQNEENKSGHARYAQARTAFYGTGEGANPRPTWFDFPRLSISFQAGNIIPIYGLDNEVTVPYGLQDFYLFMELLNQPPLIPSGSKEGAHNYTWIFYTSLQFPQMTLKGYFEPDGVSWEDSAADPTTLNWSATFLAHSMTPNPWEEDELSSAYRDFMRNTVKVF